MASIYPFIAKDLFAEHGVEVPTTWDEMIAAADAFQAKGIHRSTSR